MPGEGDDTKSRRVIIDEILDTERAYIESLTFVESHYLAGIRSAAVINEERYFGPCFSYISVILNVNRELLSRLEHSDDDCIGDIFIQVSPFLKTYTLYCNAYDAVAKTVDSLSRSHTAFRRTLRRLEADAFAQGRHAFLSYLVMPVQRIPRYTLLLDELIARTPDHHPDAQPLRRAVHLTRDVSQYVNEHLRSAAHHERILTLRQRIAGLPFELLVPHRRLLWDTAALESRPHQESPRHVFLFSDILLLVRPRRWRGAWEHREGEGAPLEGSEDYPRRMKEDGEPGDDNNLNNNNNNNNNNNSDHNIPSSESHSLLEPLSPHGTVQDEQWQHYQHRSRIMPTLPGRRFRYKSHILLAATPPPLVKRLPDTESFRNAVLICADDYTWTLRTQTPEAREELVRRISAVLEDVDRNQSHLQRSASSLRDLRPPTDTQQDTGLREKVFKKNLGRRMRERAITALAPSPHHAHHANSNDHDNTNTDPYPGGQTHTQEAHSSVNTGDGPITVEGIDVPEVESFEEHYDEDAVCTHNVLHGRQDIVDTATRRPQRRRTLLPLSSSSHRHNHYNHHNHHNNNTAHRSSKHEDLQRVIDWAVKETEALQLSAASPSPPSSPPPSSSPSSPSATLPAFHSSKSFLQDGDEDTDTSSILTGPLESSDDDDWDTSEFSSVGDGDAANDGSDDDEEEEYIPREPWLFKT